MTHSHTHRNMGVYNYVLESDNSYHYTDIDFLQWNFSNSLDSLCTLHFQEYLYMCLLDILKNFQNSLIIHEGNSKEIHILISVMKLEEKCLKIRWRISNVSGECGAE